MSCTLFRLFALSVLFAAALPVGAAQAANDHTTTYFLGSKSSPLSSGSDDIAETHLHDDHTLKLTGYLAANTMITFTYSSHNFTEDKGDIFASGRFGKSLESYSEQKMRNGTFTKNINADGSGSSALVFTSAQFATDDSSAATVVIKNLSADVLRFYSLFKQFGGKKCLDPDIAVHYEVSAVPLPAALPLFGAGLAGLAGLRMRRRKAA